MVYKRFDWKEGARFDADPQKVGEELETCHYRDATEVVEIARDPATELNKIIFKLNDEDAAEEYRLDRARLVLRSIITVQINKADDGTETMVSYRSYEPVHDDRNRGMMTYERSQTVMATPNLRRQYLDRIKKDIGGVINSVDQYVFLIPELSAARDLLIAARDALPTA